MKTKQDKIRAFLRRDTSFVTQNNALCFLSGNRLPRDTAGGSLIGAIQNRLKRYGAFYYFLLYVFSPVIPTPEFKRHLRELLNRNGTEAGILNLGSGPQVLKFRDDIINVDLYAFDAVDMVADAEDLPVINDSIDLILNLAMLEHVEHPERVVQEMRRVLRPGGAALCYLPFMVPLHAAPRDYHRWTMSGAKSLFGNFDEVEVGVGAGPTSGMLWSLQEWLAMMLSFGSRRLHDALFLLLMVSTAPIKLLDLLFARHPRAENIAGGFYVVAWKTVAPAFLSQNN